MFGKNAVFVGLCLAALVVAGLIADLQGADSRHMMNLQGRLTDTAGNPTSGDHLFELRIFDDGSAGTQLYYEAQISTVNSGIYNILVGDGHLSFTGTSTADYSVQGINKTGGIPSTVFDREDLWLEVEVDQDNPLRPRTKIVSSAFAYRALKADSVAGTPGGGGSAISISGSTITDAGGGAVMGRGSATAATPNDPMSGALVSIASITKTTDASKLRVTYSDNFTRGAAGTLDCNWTISVGATAICTFGVGQKEDDNSGTFASSAGSNQTTTNTAPASGTANTTATNQNNSFNTDSGSKSDWDTGGAGGTTGTTFSHLGSWGSWSSGGGMLDWTWGWGGKGKDTWAGNDWNYFFTNWSGWNMWFGHAHSIQVHFHDHSLGSHTHPKSSNTHTHNASHNHSQDAHSHAISTGHTHDMGHTHSTTLTVKDNWTTRVPVMRLCLGTGIPKGAYPVTVTGAGGPNCRAGDGGVLIVDEVF